MRQTARIFAILALLGSAALSVAAGWAAVRAFEQLTLDRLEAQRDAQADAWAAIAVDGLRVEITGDAPNELARFQFLRRISAVVPARRLVDRTQVAASTTQSEPAYSLQVLRNPGAVSLIGLVPIIPDLPIQGRVADLAPEADLTDMLERVDRTPPEAWIAALGFGLDALAELERAKLSVTPGEVVLSGVAADEAALGDLTERLEASVPEGVSLVLDLSAPRRVISPFRFDGQSLGGRVSLDACTMETEAGAAAIADEARALGADVACEVGLGAPSASWPEVVGAGLEALAALTDARIAMTDNAIVLTGLQGQDGTAFTTAVDQLEAALPSGFSLTALPPPPPPETVEVPDLAPPSFQAELGEDGTVTLSGDLPDDILRQTTESFARAQFGFAAVTNDTVSRDQLPPGWPVRVTSGLQALALLRGGRVDVGESDLTIDGNATSAQAEDQVRRILAATAPQGTTVSVQIALVEDTRPDISGIVVPDELCAEQIALILDRNQIIFPPSETEIDVTSLPIIDAIAEILKQCAGARFEIAGHTDSQGRESSNLALSQARADSVLAAILDRGVELVFLSTRGYGETDPIAENDTDEGRALNRRIEFRLITEDGDAALHDHADHGDDQVAQDDTDSLDSIDLVEQGAGDADSGDAGAAEEAATDADPAPVQAEDAEPPTVTDEAPAEPDAPDPETETAPQETPDITPAPRPELNTSGNILDRPRPRPQRLPQIFEEE